MKLKNRMFTALLLLAFLPVALISLITLELASGSLDRLTSPGIANALGAADSIATLTMESVESMCADGASSMAKLPHIDSVQPGNFDFAIVTDRNTTAWIGDIPDSTTQERILAFHRDSSDIRLTDRIMSGDMFIIVGKASAYRDDRHLTITVGRNMGSEIVSLYERLGRNTRSFERLGQLKHPGKNTLRILWTAFVALYLLLILLISRITARKLTMQLSKLGDLAETVGRGQWDVRLEYNRNDEIGALTSGFNRMSQRLGETTRKLIETEKIAAWQQTARVIAHGLKNMLAPIRLAVARLPESSDKNESADLSPMTTINAELSRLEKAASDFSRYGRPVQPNAATIDPNAVVKQAISVTKGFDVKLDVDLDSNLPRIKCDGALLRDALINLVKNACEAIGQGGSVAIRTRSRNDLVEIAVSDTGPGINREIRDRIFEPYVTTKSSGTGLGLAIVRKIVESSGGTIDMETGDSGTIFTLKFEAANE
jgi:nitrogen fixation/metabolism regulation signal transduction histidine kinase